MEKRIEVNKIITKGSIKKKALLVMEDIAHTVLEKDRLLSEEQYNTIKMSLSTGKGKTLLETYSLYNERVRKALMNLQGLKFEVLLHLSELKGFVLLWNYAEGMELLANSILSEIEDPKKRKEIADKEVKILPFLWTELKADKEGYLDMRVDFSRKIYTSEDGSKLENPRTTKEYTLYHIIQERKKLAEKTISKYLGWAEATLDYMRERDFNIESYYFLIWDEMEMIKTPPIKAQKYTGITAPERLAKLMKIYKVMPDKVEADKDAYNWFKTNVLKDDK